jgi:hypothetical protein
MSRYMNSHDSLWGLQMLAFAVFSQVRISLENSAFCTNIMPHIPAGSLPGQPF